MPDLILDVVFGGLDFVGDSPSELLEASLDILPRLACLGWLCLLAWSAGLGRLSGGTTTGGAPVGEAPGLCMLSGYDFLLALAIRGDISSSGARNCLARCDGECDNPGRTGRLLTCAYRGLAAEAGFLDDSKYGESSRILGSSVFCLERCVGRTCAYVACARGLGGRSGLISSSVGVAFFLNFSAHSACQASTSLSGTRGNASVGRSTGNVSPVSGFLIPNLTAFCINGTCSSGPSNISIDCHCTNPLCVSAGMEGGSKLLLVGWRLCWQPILAYIQLMDE